jgi:hypothetical protein
MPGDLFLKTNPKQMFDGALQTEIFDFLQIYRIGDSSLGRAPEPWMAGQISGRQSLGLAVVKGQENRSKDIR